LLNETSRAETHAIGHIKIIVQAIQRTIQQLSEKTRIPPYYPGRRGKLDRHENPISSQAVTRGELLSSRGGTPKAE
jgi:hypothetical protein